MMPSCYLWALYLALALMCIGAHLGGILVAWCSELRSRLGGPKFGDKFAQQMVGLSFRSLAGAVLLLGAGVAVTRERSMGRLLGFIDHFPQQIWIWLGGGLLLGLVCLALYAVSWKPLRRSKGIHLVLGLLSLLSLWGAFIWLSNLATGYAAGQWLQGTELARGGKWLFALDHPLFWSVAGLLLILSLAGAGVFGCGYVLLRRNRDDFGRDYYRFAVQLAAKWALISIGLIPGFAALLWLVQRWEWIPSAPIGASILGLALLCQAAALALWVRLIRSEHPLRLKGSVATGVALTWLAVSAWMLSFPGLPEALGRLMEPLLSG